MKAPHNLEAIRTRIGEVPLERAMLLWNPRPHGDGAVIIVPHRDEWATTATRDMHATTCACYAGWEEATNEKRLRLLFTELWLMVTEDKIDPAVAHAAANAIPEYREALTRNCADMAMGGMSFG